MSRILAIDYGRKRTGLAVTDPLGMIATGLDTISTATIWDFLDEYLGKEDVSAIVVGYPRQMNNQPSESVEYIDPFLKKLRDKYPGMNIDTFDERFTSKMAVSAMIEGGMKKKDRRNKGMIDKISAVIILQSWLEYIENMQNRGTSR